MEKSKYIITYINAIGELMTIERTLTEEEFKERIKRYRQINFKIKSVVKEVITISYVEVKY